MKNEEIEFSIREWAAEMIDKYDWLSIRFEYSEQYCCYIVSYYTSLFLDDNHPFYKDASDFENLMNLRYLDDAPLFCDNERLFKLSEESELIARLSWVGEQMPCKSISIFSNNYEVAPNVYDEDQRVA